MAAEFRHSPGGGYQADYALSPTVLAAGQALSTETRLFAGAKQKALLDRYQSEGIPLLSYAIDWGWFYWFMIPIFDLLLSCWNGRQFRSGDHLPDADRPGIMFPIAQKSSRSPRSASSSRR